MKFVVAFLFCFGFTLIAAYFGLPLLRRWHLGQDVREEGPKAHYKKRGTPTMGGFFFILPILGLALLRLLRLAAFDHFLLLTLLSLFFGLVGFADDAVKVRVRKEGLSVKEKILALGFISLLFSLFYVYGNSQGPILLLPFSEQSVSFSSWGKVIYVLLIVLYLFYVSNSVNLTDGEDGLATTVTTVTALMLATAVVLLKRKNLPIDTESLIEYCLALAGGCAGFFIVNRHPAKVFMGDTGSLFLGASVAAIPLLAGVPWLIFLTGIVYMVEGLSVLLQVSYFKLSHGKRIFRMSPLHHHFELGGWKEEKIVLVFAVTELAGGLLALFLI